MDNQRLLVWAFFGFMLFLTWQTWMEDHAVRPEPAVTAAETPSTAPAPASDAALPALQQGDGTTPELQQRQPETNDVAPEPAARTGQRISVVSDVLTLEINTLGGTIERAVLTEYPVAKDQPDVPVVLLSPERQDLGLLVSGVLFEDGREDAPTQFAQFDAPSTRYDLGSGDELRVPLTWTNDEGHRLEKTFVFRRGSYAIDIEQRFTNDSSEPWAGGAYAQIQRRAYERERSMLDVDTYSFDGPVIFDGDKSTKLDRDDLIDDGPVEYRSAAGWIATIQHHFLTALVPPIGDQDASDSRFSVRIVNDVAFASLVSPTRQVPAGEQVTFTTTAFVGPKLQAQLEEIHPRLKLTVDYGWLTVISNPLFWLLSFIYTYVANWGVAIIIVTILIKLVFYKLTEASGRSMAKMREIQPRMKALQERYKDDRQALSQAMMDLYKREKVNPAAGCLPILIQMPFFLAFYWVLLESVEMRQAPFALWITDLSSRDPFFILPLIMGAAMLLQQKLNPAPADPVQAKVMQIMPVMFTVFFAFFPSGLVLYWVTNTVLSIAQQWYINKVVHAEAVKAKGGKGAGKKKKPE